MLAKLETYLLVTVIAGLVWLYAEGQAVRTHDREPLRIQFVAPAGQEDTLAITPRSPERIEVTLAASSGQMSQLKKKTMEGPIQIEINEASSGSVVLRDLLNRSELGRMGLNIVETNPTTLTVTVEPIDALTLPIEVRAPGMQLGPTVTIEPDRVDVRLPRSLAEQAGNQRIYAQLDELQNIGSLEVNVPHTYDVPLKIPPALDNPWATLGRSTTRVTFTIRKQTDTFTLTTVPIHLNIAPLMLRQYSVEPGPDHQVLRDIRLTGPVEVIDQIRRRQIRVWAELRPSSDDLINAVESLPVYLNLPPGVECETPLPHIPVTITELPSGND